MIIDNLNSLKIKCIYPDEVRLFFNRNKNIYCSFLDFIESLDPIDGVFIYVTPGDSYDKLDNKIVIEIHNPDILDISKLKERIERSIYKYKLNTFVKIKEV